LRFPIDNNIGVSWRGGVKRQWSNYNRDRITYHLRDIIAYRGLKSPFCLLYLTVDSS